MWWQLPAFGAALVFFHSSEFLIAAVMDRENLSARCELADRAQRAPHLSTCFLLPCCPLAPDCANDPRLSHHPHARPPTPASQSLSPPPHPPPPVPPPPALLFSKPYLVAMACGLAEYLLEDRFVPQVKRRWEERLSWLGLALLVAGEALRKTAMVGHDCNVIDDDTGFDYGCCMTVRLAVGGEMGGCSGREGEGLQQTCTTADAAPSPCAPHPHPIRRPPNSSPPGQLSRTTYNTADGLATIW
jgi:hypothetical protein